MTRIGKIYAKGKGPRMLIDVPHTTFERDGKSGTYSPDKAADRWIEREREKRERGSK